MIVKILNTLAGIEPNGKPFCYYQGNVVNVPEYFAADWIKFHYAEASNDPAQ